MIEGFISRVGGVDLDPSHSTRDEQYNNMASSNPIDYFAIQNTLARYCIALDTKDFDLFDQVFTTDVDAIYPFRSPMHGAQELAAAIKKR